jgi:hypothetical protein
MLRNDRLFCYLTSLFIVVVLLGCTREYYISILEIDDNRVPTFCVSRYDKCQGDNIQLADFFVAEVDKTGSWVSDGKTKNLFWRIIPEENVSLRIIKYGEVPEGWREISKSKTLAVGLWYTIGGAFYMFVGENEINVISKPEFFKRFQE